MKRNIFLQIIGVFIASIGFFACSSDNEEKKGLPIKGEDDISLTLRAGENLLSENLNCNLYIFSTKTSGSGYILQETMALGNVSRHRIRFMNKDLDNHYYRFLFVATPMNDPEISTKHKNSSPLAVGAAWEDVMITADKDSISEKNYYGILDKDGTAILNEGSIDGIMNRLPGQINLDIFRMNGNVDAPMDIVSTKIASVLDRVFRIEVKYTGLTNAITFDNAHNIIEKSQYNTPYVQNIYPVLGDTLQVNLAQEQKGLALSSSGKKGGVKIKGFYGFPCTEKVTMKLTFHYYDTTPICGNDHTGVHTTSCFTIKTLELNLPKENSSYKPLSIFSNHYTLSKAGIRTDRIIDLDVNVPIELDYKWANE